MTQFDSSVGCWIEWLLFYLEILAIYQGYWLVQHAFHTWIELGYELGLQVRGA